MSVQTLCQLERKFEIPVDNLVAVIILSNALHNVDWYGALDNRFRPEGVPSHAHVNKYKLTQMQHIPTGNFEYRVMAGSAYGYNKGFVLVIDYGRQTWL